MTNNMGPILVPWGTPPLTRSHWEVLWPSLTQYLRSVRKLHIQRTTYAQLKKLGDHYSMVDPVKGLAEIHETSPYAINASTPAKRVSSFAVSTLDDKCNSISKYLPRHNSQLLCSKYAFFSLLVPRLKWRLWRNTTFMNEVLNNWPRERLCTVLCHYLYNLE